MGYVINIAFQGGTHGNFLRYFLDKFSSLTPDILDYPFTSNGTSHKNINYSGKFQRYHPSNISPYFTDIDEKHILITIEENDLLFLQRIIHKRTGDFNIDLIYEKITFPKNYIENYRVNPKFFELYGKNIDDTVEIPRFILRDFLKLNFLNLSQDGFISNQKKYLKKLPKQTLFFPVDSFWDENKFFKEVDMLNEKLNLQLILNQQSKNVFAMFQNAIKELSTKNRCNEIIECVKNKKYHDLSQIDCVEQAYLSSYIEQNYKFILVPNTNYFFQNTNELLDWIDWYPQHYKAMNPNLSTFNNIPNPFYLQKNRK